MALIDFPMTGNATRASWVTSPNLFDVQTDAFKDIPGIGTIGLQSGGPTLGNPWWFIVDFQSAMPLKAVLWHQYSNSGDIPSVVNIYGSATGAFAGEETLVQAITGAAKDPLHYYIAHAYTIDSPQSFQYFKFEIIQFESGYGTVPSYMYGLAFMFTEGTYTYDTTANYVEPLNKFVSPTDDWTYSHRTMFGKTDIDTKFYEFMSLFVEDFGWTVDTYAFPQYFVVSNKGKNDDQPEVSYLMYISGSSLRCWEFYGYWDRDTKTPDLICTTHASSNSSTYEGIGYSTSNTQGFSVMGNKDFVLFNSAYNYTSSYAYSTLPIGRLPSDSILRPAHTTMTSAHTAGASVNIEVASSAGFEVGSYYCLWGVDGEGRDHGVQCTAIPDATHVTVDTLPRDYSSGSFIGTYPQLAFFFSQTIYNFGQRHISGTLVGTGTYYGRDLDADSYIDPSGVQGKHILLPFLWIENAGPTDPGVLAWDSHISTDNYSQLEFDVNLVGASMPMTVTSAGVKTLTDTTQTWTVNEFAGKFVYISAGTGYKIEGSFYEIASNTADTLTITYDWLTQPVATDTFYISDEVWIVTNTDFLPVKGAVKCGG